METGEKQRVIWNCEAVEGWDGAGGSFEISLDLQRQEAPAGLMQRQADFWS